MQTSPVGGTWMFGPRSASRTCSGDRNPRSVFVGRICSCPMTGAPATSLLNTCESKSSTTSWPGRVCVTTETRLPCVPAVTKSPAGLPSRCAASASRRRTVGSSPQTSSPTSARAMASRISGVGSVSVSDRRSTMSCTWLPLGSETHGRPPAPLGEPVVDRQAAEELDRLVPLALVEVHLGEQEERFRDHEGPRIVLEHELQALARGARVALIEVVRRHPELFLGEPPPAHVDLREGVGEV